MCVCVCVCVCVLFQHEGIARTKFSSAPINGNVLVLMMSRACSAQGGSSQAAAGKERASNSGPKRFDGVSRSAAQNGTKHKRTMKITPRYMHQCTNAPTNHPPSPPHIYIHLSTEEAQYRRIIHQNHTRKS